MFVFLKKLLAQIEDLPIKPWQLLAWWYFITIIRTLLEAFTDSGGHLSGFQPFFLQYPAYYAVAFMGIIIILKLITNEKIEKIAKVFFLFSFFIFIGPTVDALLSASNNISYISVDNWPLILKSYLTIGLGGIFFQGTTSGIKFELIFALLSIFLYLKLKGVTIIKSLLGISSIYFFIISTFLITTYIKFFYLYFGLTFNFTSQFIGLFWTIITTINTLIFFYLWDKTKLKNWFYGLDWFRTTLVWLVMTWGIVIYFNQRFDPALWQSDWPAVILKMLAVTMVGFLIWQIIRLINDFVDFDFDHYSQSPNLLNQLPKSDLITVLIFYLIFFLFLALQINYTFFVLLLIYILIGYFYSCKPIFLKRHFISTAVALSLNYLLAFWAGYAAFFTTADSLNLVPRNISLLIFLTFVAVIGFKDVKDELSDKQQGVVTLVTRYGVNWAAKIISLMIILVILLGGWLWHSWPLLIFALIAFAAAYYLTNGFTIFKNKIALAITLILFSIAAPIVVSFNKPLQASIGAINLKNDAGWHPTANQEAWDISSLLTDQNGDRYFFSQNYSLLNGSTLTLIDLQTKQYYKEYFPDEGFTAITKNILAINQYIPGYHGSNVFYDNNRGPYILKTYFADGLLELTAKEKSNGNLMAATPNGVLSLKNGGMINQYSQPNLVAKGRLIFTGQKIINISGPFWLEHRWGNFTADWRQLNLITINLDDETKIMIAYLGYDNGSLAYGGLLKNNELQNFSQLTIRVDQDWQSPTTNQKWPIKLNLANRNINLELEAILPNQEAPQNTWSGPMTVTGEVNGQPVAGWANFSELRPD
ncbi:MAG: UbiA family prenyltransferase [Patescibacteria group bacterium]|nr:UbiA family prenyltransferase [Patescibacteria group bacterium]